MSYGIVGVQVGVERVGVGLGEVGGVGFVVCGELMEEGG